jgi:Uncharacterized protein conserved in bacteria (DUF2252)
MRCSTAAGCLKTVPLPGRGPAMASDLAAAAVSGPAVQARGDAHLSNFGIIGSAGSAWSSTS